MKTHDPFDIGFIGDFLSKIAEKSESVYWLSSPDFKKIIYISPAYERIWGRSRDILYKTPELWITYLHPEDAKTYHPIHTIAQKIAQFGELARYDENYRILRPDGEVRWIIDRGFPIYQNGKCHGVTGVAIDITQQKQHEIELEEAKIKAEQANEAKTYFLATMSHELRTPLNGILGMAQVLNLTKQTEEQKDFVNDIIQSGKHLLSLINDILDYTKLETGKTNLVPVPADLSDILEETTSLLGHQAKLKILDFQVSVPSSVPRMVIVDSRTLKQILYNIIGNAIKFTKKGFVKVTVQSKMIASKNAAVYEFIIQDSGIGMPKSLLKNIFDRFTQADTSYTRAYGGAGLGLSISKKLAELMNGTIKVKSEQNKGSTFTCILQLPLQDEYTSHVENTNSTKRTSPENISKKNNDPFALSAPLSFLQEPYILMVEDNLINQKTQKLLLQDMNIKVDIAENAAVTIEKIQNKYDLILMDINLPDISGFDLTKLIRKQKSPCQRIPIIGITAHAYDYEIKKCIKSGMNCVLTKPINYSELNQILRQYLKPFGTRSSKHKL